MEMPYVDISTKTFEILKFNKLVTLISYHNISPFFDSAKEQKGAKFFFIKPCSH